MDISVFVSFAVLKLDIILIKKMKEKKRYFLILFVIPLLES